MQQCRDVFTYLFVFLNISRKEKYLLKRVFVSVLSVLLLYFKTLIFVLFYTNPCFFYINPQLFYSPYLKSVCGRNIIHAREREFSSHGIFRLLASLTDGILVEAAHQSQFPCPKVSRKNRLSEWRVNCIAS